MNNVARIGDTHVGECDHGMECCPHSVKGLIVGGSEDTITNGKKQARHDDIVHHDCPHCGTGRIVASAGSVLVNGMRIAKKKDVVIYPGGAGVITKGSEDTFSY